MWPVYLLLGLILVVLASIGRYIILRLRELSIEQHVAHLSLEQANQYLAHQGEVLVFLEHELVVANHQLHDAVDILRVLFSIHTDIPLEDLGPQLPALLE